MIPRSIIVIALALGPATSGCVTEPAIGAGDDELALSMFPIGQPTLCPDDQPQAPACLDSYGGFTADGTFDAIRARALRDDGTCPCGGDGTTPTLPGDVDW